MLLRRPLHAVGQELGLQFAADLGWWGTIGGIDVLMRRQKGGKTTVTCAAAIDARFAMLRTDDRDGLLAANHRTGDAEFDGAFHVTTETHLRLDGALDGLMRAALVDAEPIRSIRGQDDHLHAVLVAADDDAIATAVTVLTEFARRFVTGSQAA